MEVLVADDDAGMRAVLRSLLSRDGHVVIDAEDGQGAIEVLAARHGKPPFDLVITDLRMPRADGFEVLARVRERQPRTPVVILTAQGSIRDCVAAMRAGAFNFLTKPFHHTELAAIVRQAGELRARSAEALARARDARPLTVSLIGESAALRAVIDTVERVAASSSTVLITGESGTGKEVVARLLHGASGRSAGPFVAVNCGAIPENLIESELFGHARGAFSGAVEAHPGKFVQADGGTLFLDEVGELPLPLQVKLLRALQDREITPVGGTHSRTVDVRIVAATNRDLEAMAADGRFRRDLYYRLDVVPIRLPALRDRPDDIPVLVRHFLDQMNMRFQREVALADDALALMTLYAWPGNVREMENLIERLVVLDSSGVIRAGDLPERLKATPGMAALATVAASLERGSIDLPAVMASIESSLIEQAVRQAGGNKTRAAELLGLSRTTLLDKLKRQS
ncbi:MAG TPA: sigma-54 dependent transcriptional regulator [Steroidobacteraceae bacterium]|nr:sigma-54 dependent transcriptional regulator [Steroidobacteraceae bacterium]